jgi:hypothetical protein
MKLPELVTWVLPHALNENEKIDTDLKLDSEKQSQQSQTTSGKIKIIHTFDDFEQKILDQEEAAIVYFASNDDKPGMPLLV